MPNSLGDGDSATVARNGAPDLGEMKSSNRSDAPRLFVGVRDHSLAVIGSGLACRGGAGTITS